MEHIQETIKKRPGLSVHLIRTEKFKTNTVMLRLKAPIDEKTATHRALLPYVLQNSTKQYPTTAALRSYLDELYGATLYADLAKKGEYHIISVTMEIANEKFLQDQTPLLEKGMNLLRSVILDPNAESGAFDNAVVEREKRNLRQRIQSVFDDKMRYASTRLIEEMCKGEPYAVPVNGSLDEVDAITAESLYAYYQKVIAEDQIDLFIVGDLSEVDPEPLLENWNFAERKPKEAAQTAGKTIEMANTVKEVQKLNQGKLNIGYRTHIRYGDADYFPLQVFNGIFGGFPHSKLFVNVREKASLAYYAASRLESHKGLMLVMSGIESDKFDRTVAIIEEQLEAMKKGDFSDEVLQQTKSVIQNQLLETLDSSRGMIEMLYHNVLAKTDIKPEDWLTAVENTTKEQIVEAAGKVELDTVYFLSGEGE